MQLKYFARPLGRFNYFISPRNITQNHSTTKATKQDQIPTSALKKREKDENNKSKLKMQGWQIHSYGGVEELQFSDKLKVPQLRQANECLVRVTTTTVNPIDVAMLSNDLNNSHKGYRD